MKALLIHAPSNFPEHTVPCGLSSIIPIFRKYGYHIDTLDLEAHPDSVVPMFPNPDIVAVSAHKPDQKLITLIKNIKNNCTDSIIIAGGSATLHMPHKLLNAGVDHIIQGEGEIPLKSLLSNITRSISTEEVSTDKRLKITGGLNQMEEDIDSLPFPDYLPFIDSSRGGMLVLKSPALPLVTSRGCDMKCSHCQIPATFGPWRGHSVEYIEEFTDLLVRNTGVRELIIEDSCFMNDHFRVEKLCRIFRKHELSWQVSNGIHPEHLNPELIMYMASSGCHSLDIGLECPDSWKLLRRKTPENISEILLKIKKLKKRNRNSSISIGGYFMLGLPKTNLHFDFETAYWAYSLALNRRTFSMFNACNAISFKPEPAWAVQRNPESFIPPYRKASLKILSRSLFLLRSLEPHFVLWVLKRLQASGGPEILKRALFPGRF